MHLFRIRTLQPPLAFDEGLPQQPELVDEQKIIGLEKFLEDDSAPVFAQVHLMGTHGGKFYPAKRYYSMGKEQLETWMMDFYDDAIAEYDHRIETLYEYLKDTGKLENTLLFITADHGVDRLGGERVPLLIRFPGGKYNGSHLKQNVQLADIAPTVLRALNLPQPEWMIGTPLLEKELAAKGTMRPIFIAQVSNSQFDRSGPPFYGIQFLHVLICQKQYVFDFPNAVLLQSQMSLGIQRRVRRLSFQVKAK